MKELDDIIERINACSGSIIVKGKAYPSNNPYIINKINNLLYAEKLSLEDIIFDDKKIEVFDDDQTDKCIFSPQLEKITIDINQEYEEIQDRQ